jgi:hypothetical protein
MSVCMRVCMRVCMSVYACVYESVHERSVGECDCGASPHLSVNIIPANDVHKFPMCNYLMIRARTPRLLID